jgi:bla regulator protein BlaR1
MGSQSSILQALGWAIINSLWQLAFLWVVYQCITGVFRHARPSTKSSLASSLLVAGFGWFIYTFIFALRGEANGSSLINANADANSVLGTVNASIRFSLPYASIVYLILLIVPLLRFTRNYRYVQVIRKYGLSRIDPEWKLFVSRISALMGIKKPVHIYVSEWVSSPVTIGFLKPVILVPLAAINNLSPSQMEAILLHELSHIRRFDYLVNFLINAIRVVLYFNPFAKAFVRIVETEREKSCDQMVMQFQYDTHDYATALLMLEKLSTRNRILLMAASGQQHDLLCRVEAMLGLKKGRGVNLRQAMAVITGIICVLSVNALLLVSKPTTRINATGKYTAVAQSAYGHDMADLTERPEKLVNHIARQKDVQAKISAQASKEIAATNTTPSPEYVAANFELPEPVVELDKAKENQVKEAVEASRRVLETVQWKQVEKSLADAFNENEKQKMRNEWQKEMNNKVNWQVWENRLRQAYDQVDWDRVNVQLDNAIKQIQVDSLLTVYNHTMLTLRSVQRQLKDDSLNGIPDTDITLREIAEKQKQVQKAVLDLRKVKARKIVRL